MEIKSIVDALAQTIQKEANARAVFGEAIKLDNHVIVPVASITIGFGGGGGGASRTGDGKADDGLMAKLAGFGGGGGGGLEVKATPIGFIHEEDGKVMFFHIAQTAETPHSDSAAPGLAERLRAMLPR